MQELSLASETIFKFCRISISFSIITIVSENDLVDNSKSCIIVTMAFSDPALINHPSRSSFISITMYLSTDRTPIFCSVRYSPTNQPSTSTRFILQRDENPSTCPIVNIRNDVSQCNKTNVRFNLPQVKEILFY